MTAKSLKTDFSPSAPAAPDFTKKEAPEGRYPRSFHIIDFALHNLFSAAYALPHCINLPVINDSAEYMTLEEIDIASEEADLHIDPVYVLPDPIQDFAFQFEGAEDWAPFTATLLLLDTEGSPLDKYDAHPFMRTAFEEFMNDIALAVTELEGIRVNVDKGTVRANDPLLLYRALHELIIARNEDTDFANLPDDGYDISAGTNDADGDRARLIVEGADFMNDDHTEDLALQNIPSRPYNSLTDLFLVAQNTRTRLECGAPMLRLDEMESIILEETRNRKSYSANPLLNRH